MKVIDEEQRKVQEGVDQSQALWSPEENEYLIDLKQQMEKQGKVSWKMLAEKLNDKFHKGKQIRDRLKVRQRFHNKLEPKLKRGEWTQNEDRLILQGRKSNLK